MGHGKLAQQNKMVKYTKIVKVKCNNLFKMIKRTNVICIILYLRFLFFSYEHHKPFYFKIITQNTKKNNILKYLHFYFMPIGINILIFKMNCNGTYIQEVYLKN